MKITSDELKQAFKSNIQRHVPPSRKRCPSKESILSIFENSLSSRKKDRIIDHVVKCAYCHQEFELFLGLSREEGKTAKEISEWLREKDRESVPARKPAKIRSIIFFPWAGRRNIWKLAAISIAFLIFTFSLISIRTILKSKLNEERGKIRDQVRLISPAQGQAVTRPLIFRWTKVIKAEFYQLEIFDATLLPLWKSPPVTGLSLALPPELETAIKENEVYFWMVIAVLPGGMTRESPLERFILDESPSLR